jgi:UDP-N-acetylglucosamine 2-epimerase (non-hydrolysing)
MNDRYETQKGGYNFLMQTILTVFGTRPEAIKMAPVIQELAKHPLEIKQVVCVTAQHRQMLDQVLELFNIQPDFDLDLMKPNQSLAQLTASAIAGLDPIFNHVKPDWILVQGDTTTVTAAALVAYYHQIKVGHVEAGLRTNDKYQPFPEEINRRLTDVMSDLYFAPTQRARQNLLQEGVEDAKIHVTGNTVIDALLQASLWPFDWSSGPLACIPQGKRLVLITAHRRESFGQPFRDLCNALGDLALHYADTCHFVYPVHLNPHVQDPVREILGHLPNVSLIAPLDYLPMVHLMQRSDLILTDSGGIQEEAPSLGKPVLVMRETTERPEVIECGAARLVGTDRSTIYAAACELLDNDEKYAAMAHITNPFGDGHAARKITEILLNS